MKWNMLYTYKLKTRGYSRNYKNLAPLEAQPHPEDISWNYSAHRCKMNHVISLLSTVNRINNR